MTGDFKIDPNVHLLPLAVVQVVVGRDHEAVLELIEEGWLLHAFNVATGEDIRELRVWRGSLIAFLRKAPDKSSLDDVLADVFPSGRPRLRSTDLAKSWSVSRQQIWRFAKLRCVAAEVKDHTLWITRESAIQFLTSRVSN